MAQSTLGDTEEAQRDWVQEASTRAESLAEKMNAVEAADGIKHDRDSLRNTGVNMHELMTASLEEAKALAQRATEVMATLSAEHGTDGNALRALVKGSAGANAVVLDAETSAKAALRSIRRTADAHALELQKTKGEAKPRDSRHFDSESDSSDAKTTFKEQLQWLPLSKTLFWRPGGV